jgi:hypothetical protein
MKPGVDGATRRYLIGLAVHFLWIVAIIIMSLGLGCTVANSRRDPIDAINQQADGSPVPAQGSAGRPH